MHRPAVLLLLVLAPLTAAASGPVAEIVGSPAFVSADAWPFSVLVRVRASPGPIDVKAWLGGEDWMASQTWSGSGWERSDRYALTVEASPGGEWTGWVHVRANPDSANAPRLAAVSDLRVHVRVRTGSATADSDAPVALWTGAWREAASRASGIGVVRGREGLLAAQPIGTEAETGPGVRSPAVSDAELRWYGPAGEDLGPLPLAPSPGPSELLITRFSSRAPESVTVENAAQEPLGLLGLALEAGGKAHPLPDALLAPGGAVTFASNATDPGLAGAGRAVELPGMRIPDAGGVLKLLLGTREIDRVAFGAAAPGDGWTGPPLPALAAGEVHERVREVALGDTNTSRDWRLPPPRLGWSRFSSPEVPAGVEPFLAPDESFAALARFVRAAQEEILIASYTLTSPDVGGLLHEALRRGVEVRVLLDASPVGGLPDAERAILNGLVARGADVSLLASSGRYLAMHAKYVVADGERLLISSENLGNGGYPVRGGGNRGFGAIVHSSAVAGFFAAVFDNDAEPGRADVQRWPPTSDALVLERTSVPVPSAGRAAIPGFVTPVAGPDEALDRLLDLIASANESIHLEQLQLARWHGEGESAVFRALVDASLRGVNVSGLVAWDEEGNAEAVATLQALGASGSLVDVRLAPCCMRIHNKAFVVDREEAWIGSVNLGWAALHRNREVAVLIRSPEVARVFADAIEGDLEPAAAGTERAAHPHVWIVLGAAALAAVAIARDHGLFGARNAFIGHATTSGRWRRRRARRFPRSGASSRWKASRSSTWTARRGPGSRRW